MSIETAPTGGAAATGLPSDGAPTDGVPPGGDPATPTSDAGSAPVVDRRAAFAAGPPPIPRKAIYWTAAALVAFAVLATVINRLATGGAPVTPTTKAVTHQVVSGAPAPTGPPLHAPLPAFLGLSPLPAHPAPSWSLTDAATGGHLSLASLHGHVVVLTFADATCNDICPVLGQELAAADAALSHPAVPVTFVTINADPLATKPSAAAPILGEAGFHSLANWRFATGPLSQLDPVWVSYGISISADKANHKVSHNDLLYFIGPGGTLSWTAIPFANESTSGTYSLTAGAIARFGSGIAHYADKLAKTP